jgi:dephospho-CoA kinase
MLKVGLTGNYYSGQNESEKIFQELGVKVFDADLLLKYLINYSVPHIDSIKSNFGQNSYKMGLLNLSKFTDNKSWNNLIDLVEFDIIKSYEKYRLTHKEDFYTILKYSYIYERQINKSMDINLVCFRPKSLRKDDLLTLTYMDNYSINKLLDGEMNEIYKNEKSDFIIQNHSTDGIIGLETKVNLIHEQILKKKPQDKKNNLGYKYTSGFWD